MASEDRWTRRIPGAGALLLLFLIGILVWPLARMREIDHPLAGQGKVDLCGKLEATPQLAQLQVQADAAPSDAAGGCQFMDDRGVVRIDLMLFTIRSLADGHEPPMRIDDQYRQSREWARSVDADEFAETGEPGQRRLRYRTHSREGDVHSRQCLIEDHGVLLWIRSNSMDAGTFDALGDVLRERLRAVAEDRDAAA